MILGITAENIEVAWPIVEPLLARACRYSYDGITTEQLKKWIAAREAQLWVAAHSQIMAAMVTRIVVYPHCKALQITSCGGKNMKNWLPDVVKTFTAYGKHHGCSRLEVIGRNGWARVLKGTRVVAITITKEI